MLLLGKHVYASGNSNLPNRFRVEIFGRPLENRNHDETITSIVTIPGKYAGNGFGTWPYLLTWLMANCEELTNVPVMNITWINYAYGMYYLIVLGRDDLGQLSSLGASREHIPIGDIAKMQRISQEASDLRIKLYLEETFESR